VAITLYVAIVGLSGKEFGLETLWLLTEQFVVVGVVSIVIGMTIGFLSVLCFKQLRFMTRSVIHETCLMYCFGLIAYFGAAFIRIKGIEMSSIISIMTCAVI
jgi:NhaP-type Na+/H+ or K+/H+ antiporter